MQEAEYRVLMTDRLAQQRLTSPPVLQSMQPGNIYVADAGNNMIREITTAGMVQTIAGYRFPGKVNGLGTAASFDNPTGLAVSPSGGIYVADNGNGQIRLIQNGLVSTLCGSTTFGDNDGLISQANFTRPYNIVLDPKGNLFVAEQGSSSIRQISPDGYVVTLKGFDDTGNPMDINGPFGIAIDQAGNLFVSDINYGVISRMNTSGQITKLISGLNGPAGLVLSPNGNLYESESNGNQIQLLSNPTNYAISTRIAFRIKI